MRDDALARELRAELERLQWQLACDAHDSQLLSYMPAYGFSATLLYLPRAFSYSVKTQRMFVAHGQVAGADVADRSVCQEADMTCVYAPLARCPPNFSAPGVIQSHPQAEPFHATEPLFAMPDKYKVIDRSIALLFHTDK